MQSTAEAKPRKKNPRQGEAVGNDIVVYVRVPKKLHRLLTKAAEREDRTLAAIIRSAIAQAYQ